MTTRPITQLRTPVCLSRHRGQPDHHWMQQAWVQALGLLLLAGAWSITHAAEHVSPADAASHPAGVASRAVAKKPASAPVSEAIAPAGSVDLGIDLKKAIREQMLGKKKLTLVISDKPERVTTEAPSPVAGKPVTATPTKSEVPARHAPEAPAEVVRAPAVVAHPGFAARKMVVNPRTSRDYIQAKAAVLAGHETDEPEHVTSHPGNAHWTYAGQTGPQAWGQLKPEFTTCAVGNRQSPINIEDAYTLKGPAEPLRFTYQPSNGVVVNNGHSIQVNIQGNNTLSVRGSSYTLQQIHFHTPSEEQVNYRSFAMVAHLVHKNAEGQLAVVAVLLDPGEANTLIDKVWTYMPLDVNDEVRMPPGLLDINDLLPKDQRYYQFMGSLTTPPCSEGVLWMVLKTPVQVSAAQLRLFQQLYPSNARPVQPVNGRPIRNAQ